MPVVVAVASRRSGPDCASFTFLLHLLLPMVAVAAALATTPSHAGNTVPSTRATCSLQRRKLHVARSPCVGAPEPQSGAVVSLNLGEIGSVSRRKIDRIPQPRRAGFGALPGGPKREACGRRTKCLRDRPPLRGPLA